jgi:hypothetical protein
MTSSSWINNAGFITALDYNLHPVNAGVYGAATDWDAMRRYLREVRPDLLITQALGFWGWSSYASAIAPSPVEARLDFVDRLAALCREEQTRLGFMVESWQTVGDARPFSPVEQARWFRVDAAGNRDLGFFCPNSPFAEEFLLPYCRECLDRYAPAAFWFDHVRTRPCWCDSCQAAFRRGQGSELPRPGQPRWRVETELFNEQSFVRALEHASDALHAHAPGVVLCWANGLDHHTHRPRFRGADWIAADEVNGGGTQEAWFDSACRMGFRRPAHLWVPDKYRGPMPRQRPPEELLAEAGVLAAHGLGMTMYHIPAPDGRMGLEMHAAAVTAANFMRERAEFCVGNTPVPHVAVLLSTAQNLRYQDRFQPKPLDTRSVHAFVAGNHLPCELVTDDVLLEHLPEYPLVVLGETQLVAPATAAVLESYVHGGGTAFIIGPAPRVADPLAATPDSPRLFGCDCTVGDRIERHWADGRLTHVGQVCTTAVAGEVVWRRIENDGAPREPLLLRIRRGAGEIWWLLCTAVTEYGGPSLPIFHADDLADSVESADAILAAHNFGAKRVAAKPAAAEPPRTQYTGLAWLDYDNRPFRENPAHHPYVRHPHLRRLVGAALREALGNRWLLRSTAPAGVAFTVNRRDADLFVHVVNLTSANFNGDACPIVDSVPVLTDVEFELHLPVATASVTALPAGTDVEVVQAGTTSCRMRIRRLEYHVAVRIAGVGATV